MTALLNTNLPVPTLEWREKVPLRRGQVAEPVGRGDAAVHEEIAAGDEVAIRPHQERADGSDLVRCARATGWAELDHAPVALPPGTGQLVLRQRRDDDAGADRVDPGATPAPADRLSHHSQGISSLGQLV